MSSIIRKAPSTCAPLREEVNVCGAVQGGLARWDIADRRVTALALNPTLTPKLTFL